GTPRRSPGAPAGARIPPARPGSGPSPTLFRSPGGPAGSRAARRAPPGPDRAPGKDPVRRRARALAATPGTGWPDTPVAAVAGRRGLGNRPRGGAARTHECAGPAYARSEEHTSE